MKIVNIIVTASLMIASSAAQAGAPDLTCKGVQNGVSYQLDLFEGYGYATFFFKTTASGVDTIKSGYAHGGSFVECGSRNIPCHMIKDTQFEIENVDQLNLILTMISDAQSNTGQADLSLYGNGFNAPETAKLSVICHMK